MQNEIGCWLVANPQIQSVQWMQSETLITENETTFPRLTITCVYRSSPMGDSK